MRYFSLALVSLGALMFPYAAKHAVLGIGAETGHDLRTALILALVGSAFLIAGVIVSKQDDVTSVWRNRNRSRRIRLR